MGEKGESDLKHMLCCELSTMLFLINYFEKIWFSKPK